MVEISDTAEENLKEAKKKLEEALEEYFAALRLLEIDEPKREVGERGVIPVMVIHITTVLL